jgi:hypothetical protein
MNLVDLLMSPEFDFYLTGSVLFGATANGPKDMDFFTPETDNVEKLVLLLQKHGFRELKNIHGVAAAETYFEDVSIARVFRWEGGNDGLSNGMFPIDVQIIRKEQMFKKLKAQELLLKLGVLKNPALTKDQRKEIWSLAMAFIHSSMRELKYFENLESTDCPRLDNYRTHYHDYMNYYNV